jgi:imidazolonepropionase-like amidohydrolase
VAVVAACGGERRLEPGLLIRNVTLIDGTDRGARPGMSVAVREGRVVAVGPAGRVRMEGQPAVVDATGKYLIPGLWDMHVHLAGYGERSFPLFLASGVTTVREVGGDLQLGGWLRQESRDGRLLGPQVLIAGPTLNGAAMVRGIAGTAFAAGAVAVTDSASAVAIVDSLARVGVDHIKVHAMVPRAAYFAAIGAARRHGLAVVGHVPDSVMPGEAIEAGQRTLEHGSRHPFANSARGAELTARMLARMERYLDSAGDAARAIDIAAIRWAADDSAAASYDSATAESFAELAAKRQVWFDLTLVTYRNVLLHNEPELRQLPEWKYAPAAAREFDDLPPPGPNPTAADIAEGRRRWDAARASFAPLLRAGAKFVAGTDVPTGRLVPGFSLQRELGLLIEIGLTPLRALQAATRNAAEAAGKLHEVGTIEEGKRADMVLLDADPLADIGNAAAIRAVVVRGRLLDRRTLDRMLADAEAYARSTQP